MDKGCTYHNIRAAVLPHFEQEVGVTNEEAGHDVARVFTDRPVRWLKLHTVEEFHRCSEGAEIELSLNLD